MYRKNVASQFICFQMLLTATGAVATGLSPAVRRCIDGTFAAGGGTVTEDGTTGSYKYAMSQADTNGNDISFIFSAATAMPICINIVTTAADPTTASSFGITNIDATISSRASQTSLDTVDDFIDTEVAAIKAQTDKLTFDGANMVVADARKISTSSVAADNLEAGAEALIETTCAVGSTTTLIVTNLTEATDDHYNGRVITFTTGALTGQATNITDYNGTTKTLTVTALTEAPSDTDVFVIS